MNDRLHDSKVEKLEEIKNEIAALEKFGKENEMRPFHLWNG